ncbi:uncharacterized protein LOC119385072 [Rhipicephalus sanguineus]|uniref:uncharacterized protein LOC119385072 n=1 Tax=Rhipicephalus sanguineus TaxID=34632 RepID=UPI001895764F|nr:uncharacterized protein LOC119385072 [Rhipicephalus sanguineus]
MVLLAAAWLALASRLLAELGPLELTVEVLPSLRVVSHSAKLGLGFPFEFIIATSEDMEHMKSVCQNHASTAGTPPKSAGHPSSSIYGEPWPPHEISHRGARAKTLVNNRKATNASATRNTGS